jgi:hypothetical protein
MNYIYDIGGICHHMYICSRIHIYINTNIYSLPPLPLLRSYRNAGDIGGICNHMNYIYDIGGICHHMYICSRIHIYLNTNIYSLPPLPLLRSYSNAGDIGGICNHMNYIYDIGGICRHMYICSRIHIYINTNIYSLPPLPLLRSYRNAGDIGGICNHMNYIYDIGGICHHMYICSRIHIYINTNIYSLPPLPLLRSYSNAGDIGGMI